MDNLILENTTICQKCNRDMLTSPHTTDFFGEIVCLKEPETRLTRKEVVVMNHVRNGLRNKEIAHELNTTEQVIKNCCGKIYKKLKIHSRLELAVYPSKSKVEVL